MAVLIQTSKKIRGYSLRLLGKLFLLSFTVKLANGSVERTPTWRLRCLLGRIEVTPISEYFC